jgi:8-oxo-dGTP pyrophosphatase MutT (NUDIX family)
MQLDAVLDYLARITRVDLSRFTPLWIDGERLGYVNADWEQRLLAQEPDLFVKSRVGLCVALQGDYAARSAQLNAAARRWLDAGWLKGWRGENFLSCREDGSPLFELERAAFRPLGLTSHAVHINGLTRSSAGGIGMWVGRRSLAKSEEPDRMDNMVGGGVTAGESVRGACLREGWEEAGLSRVVLADVSKASLLLAERAVGRGLHREWLHAHDLWLPADVAPCNQDGEVAEHLCLSLDEVESLIVEERFMIDAALVAIDCLARLGYWGLQARHVREALTV